MAYDGSENPSNSFKMWEIFWYGSAHLFQLVVRKRYADKLNKVKAKCFQIWDHLVQ